MQELQEEGHLTEGGRRGLTVPARVQAAAGCRNTDGLSDR